MYDEYCADPYWGDYPDCYGYPDYDGYSAYPLSASNSRKDSDSTFDSVSVVVTARNQGEFLSACLHSILAQTVQPHQILYYDDGSEDRSLEIANRFSSHGIRVVGAEHRGVVPARNAAAKLTDGHLLLFVDGDNMLAPDFLERQLEALDERAAFAYPWKHYFGELDRLWQPPEFDRDKLWNENYIDTCALIRREVFEAIGGWHDTLADTFWDWDLFLRASRYGRGVRSDAVLYYRVHLENWGRIAARREMHRADQVKGEIRRRAARLCVCCAFGGRLPGLFPRWLEALETAFGQMDIPKPNLFLIDDNPLGFWQIAAPHLEKLTNMFASIRVDRAFDGVSAAERRSDRFATAKRLSIHYNRFLDETVDEILWFIEDDIVIPERAGTRLIHLLLDGDLPQAAVAGFYRSRHGNENRYVASVVNGTRVIHADTLPLTPKTYELTGTGCLMIFRPVCKTPFAPYWKFPARDLIVPAHDWYYSWKLHEQGQPVLLDPEVICRHYTTESEYL